MTITETVPRYLSPCVEHVSTLELENAKLKRRVQELESGPGQTDIEPVNTLRQKAIITSAELRSVIPISQSTMNKLVKEGRFSINPLRINRNTQWRSSDVLELVRRLGGQEMGFYGTQDACRLLGYQSDGGLHKAAKEKRVPQKLKLFGIVTAWVKEDIHTYLRGQWRCAI